MGSKTVPYRFEVDTPQGEAVHMAESVALPDDGSLRLLDVTGSTVAIFAAGGWSEVRQDEQVVARA